MDGNCANLIEHRIEVGSHSVDKGRRWRGKWRRPRQCYCPSTASTEVLLLLLLLLELKLLPELKLMLLLKLLLLLVEMLLKLLLLKLLLPLAYLLL